jgi:hypothetical protein
MLRIPARQGPRTHPASAGGDLKRNIPIYLANMPFPKAIAIRRRSGYTFSDFPHS